MTAGGGTTDTSTDFSWRDRPLPVGILTPVVTMLPNAHAAWEEEGTIDDVAAIAQAADGLGYDHLTCSEHVVVPVDVAAVRGSRYWDPLATFGYLAALTNRIRLATLVLVLGYHHPLEIAKRYGTLDQVSGGRLVLGLGVGSLAEDSGCSARRLPTVVPGPTMRCQRSELRFRRRRPSTKAPSIATATWYSTRAPDKRSFRSGSAAARGARFAGRSATPMAGAPSRCGQTRWPTCSASPATPRRGPPASDRSR